MSLVKDMYLISPIWLKKIFANLEALRRDYYRRWGNFSELYAEVNEEELFAENYRSMQNDLFMELISCVKEYVPAYKNVNNITSLDDITKLPILKKKDLIANINHYISNDVKNAELQRFSTSGSTGKPLKFYKDRESVRYNYIYADKMYEIVGLTKGDIKCRFSGTNLFKFNKKNPPFWLYISRYKQLQCSSYHLNEANFKSYIDAMFEYEVTFGTGYANTWLFLAEYVLKHDYSAPKLKAIVTDSEGLTNEQQDIIEEAFQCKVYQTYGLSEVGQIAFQCKNRHYHIIPQTAYVEIVDEDFNPIKEKDVGQILITSLYSKKTPFIRYVTGDIGDLSINKCGCGWKTPYFTEITGRVEDYIIADDGRKIKRLGFIMRPAKGVVSSQLIQTSMNSLLINVIPDNNFEEKSMDTVVQNAKKYLGDMKIKWNVVDELERTQNGKVRYVIRKF